MSDTMTDEQQALAAALDRLAAQHARLAADAADLAARVHQLGRVGDALDDLGHEAMAYAMLKALGAPHPDYGRVNRLALQQLIARDLAAMLDGNPTITPVGRRVVVRGSPLLWALPA